MCRNGKRKRSPERVGREERGEEGQAQRAVPAVHVLGVPRAGGRQPARRGGAGPHTAAQRQVQVRVSRRQV